MGTLKDMLARGDAVVDQPTSLKALVNAGHATAEDSGPTAGEAFLRGAGQGATLGFGDELWGAARALGDSLPESMGGDNNKAGFFSGLGDRYRKNRDEVRANNDAAEKAHGGAYLGGNLVGGLVTAPLLPGGEGATLLRALGTGAGVGAVQGLGASNSKTILGDVGNTLAGAGLGAAAGGLGFGAGKLIRGGAEAAGSKAAAIEDAMAQAGQKQAAAVTATARSAAGRSAQNAYRQLEHLRELGRLRGLTGEEAEIAQDLAEELGDKAQANLIPAFTDKLNTANALRDAAASEPERALQAAADKVNGVAWKNRGIEQLKRYGAPALAGLAYKTITGDHSLMGLGGAISMGAYARPMIRALVKQASDPFVQKTALGMLSRGLGSAGETLGPAAESMLLRSGGELGPSIGDAAAGIYANMRGGSDIQDRQRAIAEALRAAP